MIITEEQYNKHFEAIKSSGITYSNGINLEKICPICLRPFTKYGMHVESQEDAPPKALGGRKIALTCKHCNNNCGSHVDIHLVNGVKLIDQNKFVNGSDRSIVVNWGDKKFDAKFLVKDGNTFIGLSSKNTHPDTFKEVISKLDLNTIVSFKNKSLKFSKDVFEVALLKTSYIILFSKIGYNALFWKEYNAIRKQITESREHLYSTIYTMDRIRYPDGIYYCNQCWLRGFFISFSLKNPQTNTIHSVLSFIPCPQTNLYGARMALLKSEYPTLLCPLYDVDFINVPENIYQLNEWANGRSLTPFVY